MPAAKRPNFLFLFSDEHSYRCLSSRSRADGGEPVRTPTLDGLAARGVNFDANYCQSPLCSPSRMCLFTGRHADGCGAWQNECIIRPGIPTLPGVLSKAGYETALVGKLHFGGDRQYFGFRHRPYGDFNAGHCSHQLDPLSVPGGGMKMRSRTQDAGLTEIPESLLQENFVARESVSFLREQRHRAPNQPWFLCASFSRPHFPLTAPKRFFDRYWPKGVTEPRVGATGDTQDHPMTQGMHKGFRVREIKKREARKARAAYFACVDFLDEIIGDFLGTLERDGLLDNTVVIYGSDHGEMAGEHGSWWKNTWHESSMRVPFIWQLPEHRSGRLRAKNIKAPVSNADIFPTLCGLAGVKKPKGLVGVDLSKLLRGKQTEKAALADRPVIGSFLAPRWGPGTEFRMLRQGRYKYVAFRDAPDILIDLQKDPLEQKNLATKPTPSVAKTLAALRRQALRGFDFEKAAAKRLRDQKELPKKFPKKADSQTPNQIQFPDGRLVDADTVLYAPHVAAADPAKAFSDYPKRARARR